MHRKIIAALMGGAIVLGTVGMTGVAEARTPFDANRAGNAISQLLERANAACAARPSNPLCRQLGRVNQAQIDRAVSQVNQALQRGGGLGTIQSRIAPARATLCANSDQVLARVPARFQAQASQAVARLCS